MINYMPMLIISVIIFAIILLTAFLMMKMISFVFDTGEVGTRAPMREKKAPKPKPEKKIKQKTPKPEPKKEIKEKIPKPEPTPVITEPQPTPDSTDNQEAKTRIQFKIKSLKSMIQNIENQYRAGEMTQQEFFEKRKNLGEKVADLESQL